MNYIMSSKSGVIIFVKSRERSNLCSVCVQKSTARGHMTLADLGVVSVFYSSFFPNTCERSKSTDRPTHVTLNMDTRVLMFVETGSRRINIMSIYHNISLMGVDSFISKTKRLPHHVDGLVRLKRLGIFVRSIRFQPVKTKEKVYDICLLS